MRHLEPTVRRAARQRLCGGRIAEGPGRPGRGPPALALLAPECLFELLGEQPAELGRPVSGSGLAGTSSATTRGEEVGLILHADGLVRYRGETLRHRAPGRASSAPTALLERLARVSHVRAQQCPKAVPPCTPLLRHRTNFRRSALSSVACSTLSSEVPPVTVLIFHRPADAREPAFVRLLSDNVPSWWISTHAVQAAPARRDPNHRRVARRQVLRRGFCLSRAERGGVIA